MYVEVLIVFIYRGQKNNSKSGKIYCWIMGMNDNGEKNKLASPLWNHMRKWRHYMSFLKSLEKIRISKGSLFEIMKVIFSFIITILTFQILNRVIFLFKIFRLKKFCKNIKFYFRPQREIVSNKKGTLLELR